MQVIDTHVGDLADGTVTVEFKGEGNEFVSVRMASDGHLNGDAAVGRAKQMMVQLTAFPERGSEGQNLDAADDEFDEHAKDSVAASDPISVARPSMATHTGA